MTATEGTLVVAGQESRDLWVSGRGPLLLFGYSILLSAVTYMAGANLAINFLEQREAVNLVLQVAVTVGVLVALVVSADSISGERERGTLESLLLTPASRRAILGGKFLAALCVWFAAFLVSTPYLWVLAKGVFTVASTLLLGLLVGTLLAAGLVEIGLLVSAVSTSNKASLAVSLFLLLAFFAPTQLPKLPQGFAGDLIRRVNPVAAGTHYLNGVVVSGFGWTRELSYLISPMVVVVVFGGLLAAFGSRIVRLHGGVGGE